MLVKLILVGLGMVLGDILMKTWIVSGGGFKNSSIIYFILALVIYGVSLTGYAYQLKTTNFGIATSVPILINVVTVALISFFYFKEVLSLLQIVGIIFACISIVLLTL